MDTDNFSMVTGGDFDDDLSSEDLSDQSIASDNICSDIEIGVLQDLLDNDLSDTDLVLKQLSWKASQVTCFSVLTSSHQLKAVLLNKIWKMARAHVHRPADRSFT